jgi:NAD(P)-dependent dehydrogenase (short-subunit alcohol dehydrogenase family)
MNETVKAVDPLPRVWDPNDRIGDMLKGRRGLVVGIANEHSIAFGCAAKLRAFGAEVAVTYLNDKAEGYVRPLAEQIDAKLVLPLDVEAPGQLEAVFDRIRAAPGSARARDRRVGGGTRPGDARFLLVLPSHGGTRGAADVAGRGPGDDELLRRRQGGRELQHHGTR